jgi:hypothetical protein
MRDTPAERQDGVQEDSPHPAAPILAGARPDGRPLALSLMLLWDALAIGILPLLLALSLFAQAPLRQALALNPLQLLPTLILSLITLGSVFFAWRGTRIARQSLLLAVLLHHGPLAYQATRQLLDPITAPPFRGLMTILQSLLWIVLHIAFLFFVPSIRGYFTGPRSDARSGA